MSTGAATVYVVDDDASVHKGIARLLRSAGYNVETFTTATDFLESRCHQHCPACLILDVHMPGLSGMELQVRLRNLHSSIGIIFITGFADIPTSVRAIKGGAIDFLQKPLNDEALLTAVTNALEVSARLDEQHRELRALRERLATLTPREREVMELVVRGLLNKQVADQLGTVEKTVKVHRARVMEKMQAQSLAELVLMAQRAK